MCVSVIVNLLNITLVLMFICIRNYYVYLFKKDHL
jgi:hypothetical protein